MLNVIPFGPETGTPLVIAHGLFGSARNWGVIAKRLADTRPIITVDMRNHGHSDWSDDHSYTAMAADLTEVIAAQGQPVDLLGHSMGGKAAMVAALSGANINHLIVADIAPVTYSHTQMMYIDAMRALDVTTLTTRPEAEAAFKTLVPEDGIRAFLLQSLDVREQRWRINVEALARNMPHILSFPEVQDQFSGPTFFLSGALSDYVSRDARPTIKSLFPAARFAKIPGAGHWLHAEKPREFEQAVRAFLDA